jgi:hypothetical protein
VWLWKLLSDRFIDLWTETPESAVQGIANLEHCEINSFLNCFTQHTEGDAEEISLLRVLSSHSLHRRKHAPRRSAPADSYPPRLSQAINIRISASDLARICMQPGVSIVFEPSFADHKDLEDFSKLEVSRKPRDNMERKMMRLIVSLVREVWMW